MTPNIPPGWIAKALEAGRCYWDASFFLGMCQADVDPKRLEDGEVTEEEFSSARTALVKAEDDLRDAEAALTIFSNEAGYPMSATELQVRLTASPGGGSDRAVTIDREELRRLVIRPHVRMTYGGGTTPNGGDCMICKGEWDEGQPEFHATTCPLATSPPPTISGSADSALANRIAKADLVTLSEASSTSSLHTCRYSISEAEQQTIAAALRRPASPTYGEGIEAAALAVEERAETWENREATSSGDASHLATALKDECLECAESIRALAPKAGTPPISGGDEAALK